MFYSFGFFSISICIASVFQLASERLNLGIVLVGNGALFNRKQCKICIKTIEHKAKTKGAKAQKKEPCTLKA